MRKFRRAVAMSSAALALASAATLTLAGSASADTTVCGPPPITVFVALQQGYRPSELA